MKTTKFYIGKIPVIIWGAKSDKAYIYVHGKMSDKESADSFVQIAESKGYQTISFDLPEHGERINEKYRCDIWNGISDLHQISSYTFVNWKSVSLFATGVRHNAEANYNFVINIIKKETFGSKRIDKVKLPDAKGWLIKLQADGRGYSTIHTVRGVVRPAFQMAVDDDLIRKNPSEFQLATVVVNDSVTREAITRKLQRVFLEFIKGDKHFNRYYEGI